MEPGFRRRILIEPGPAKVTAELEDDYHRMVVSLVHDGVIVTEVSSQMKRSPWTTCPGAMAQLAATFTGQALADFARRGERVLNCTHLHDLAVFAAAHAAGEAPAAYDIFVSDPVEGRREARVARDGRLALAWTLQDGRIVAPETLSGRGLGELGDWIGGLDRDGAEAARILRWASILAQGRQMDIPAGISATAFPGGTCFTFQPETARVGTRRPGSDINFSAPGTAPMADRSDMFGNDLSAALDMMG